MVNFNATSISEHQETNVFKMGKDDLLKTVLMYGPNASGKSKILDGFMFYRWSILNSATDKQSNEEINTEPFSLNTSSRVSPSIFESEFYIGDLKYRYGFEVNKQAVGKEWLLEIKATTTSALFLHNNQEFEINEKKFSDGLGLGKRTRKNALFLSVAAQWNVKLAEQIIEWFDRIYIVKGMMDRDFKMMTTLMLKDNKFENSINELIRTADLGINSLFSIDFSKQVQAGDLDEKNLLLRETINENLVRDSKPVFATHNVLDDNGKVVDQALFSLERIESEGTIKFFNLAGVLIKAILAGNLVVIDELDARLHTLLTKSIVHLFNSKIIKSKAQLFAVCQDTALLDKEILRRDQIYFIEKDGCSATKLATLAEYKARKEAPYYKNYLEGKYGAIPFVENLENVIANAQKK